MCVSTTMPLHTRYWDTIPNGLCFGMSCFCFCVACFNNNGQKNHLLPHSPFFFLSPLPLCFSPSPLFSAQRLFLLWRGEVSFIRVVIASCNGEHERWKEQHCSSLFFVFFLMCGRFFSALKALSFLGIGGVGFCFCKFRAC